MNPPVVTSGGTSGLRITKEKKKKKVGSMEFSAEFFFLPFGTKNWLMKNLRSRTKEVRRGGHISFCGL